MPSAELTQYQPQELAIPLSGRLVEVGKIKIGGLSKEKRSKRDKPDEFYRLPEKYDHFVVTTLQRDSDELLIPDVGLMRSLAETHGDADGKIRRLPISVLSNDVEQVCRRRYYWFVGDKKAGESDGKKGMLWVHPNTRQWLKEPMEFDWLAPEPDQHADIYRLVNVDRAFKLHTTFNCVIRHPAARWGGVYMLRTVGEINANQIPASLLMLKRFTGGCLQLLPMELHVRPAKVSPIVKGERTSTTVYVCHVEMVGEDVEKAGGVQQLAFAEMGKQLSDARRMAVMQRQYQQLLASSSTLELDPEERVAMADVPALPPASTPTQPATGIGHMHYNTISAASTEQAARDAYGYARKDWGKLSTDERKTINALIVELKAKFAQPQTQEPAEQEETL